MTVIDNAIYVDGRRVDTPPTLDATFDALEQHGGFAWIGLYRPDAGELDLVADEFGLHALAVEDALSGHQRAKLERYGDTLFAVLRPARYLDETEKVEFGELHLFVGANFIVAVRHAESPHLGQVRHRLEASPDLLARGPLGVFYAIVDQVVDDYEPVLEGLENDVDEIEEQLFSGDAAVPRRIYDLSGEVMEFQRATKPLVQMMTAVRAELEDRGKDDEVALELRRSLRDVLDHVLRVVEKAGEIRETLQNALAVNATLVAQRQNDETQRLTEASLAQTVQTKKISSWAAIIFAPSLITGIYGMNFHYMPELALPWGYPAALLLMFAFGFGLYRVFKKRNWL
ncbi:magnesium and cobalt transport protein CorA [Microbacterium rhizosphaerae]|uniref:Magnesium and cobalt transport protein CorA n=1 Tax=Microbacterium rhizosphaerae TaxID=1678237 RepID=A0ABZ0SRE5_9MICO|nr:magnesium and cobalt transport protein CorA [Microbacterium rhizosphaerae]WPR91243.1 magnesium and cobalt transport protein CorA [Microbacterium rhizosphaerae]